MNKYNTIKVLGEGGYGKALLVESRSDRQKYVVKEVRMANLKPQEKLDAKKEVDVLHALNHPNIVRYIESFQENGRLYIVMEYADGGDLSQLISRQGRKLLSEQDVMHYFIQIALALKYMHDRKILHRDLKGQNVFLCKNGKVKLGDFGIAKVLDSTAQLCKTQIGTPYYLSPEICEGKRYNSKTDIWSLGCILYELCTLKHPFDASNMNALLACIIRGRYTPVSNTYSSDLRNLISKMLTKDQKARPSINQIIMLPFIKNHLEEYLDDTLLKYELGHTIIHGRKPLKAPTILLNKDENNNLAPIPEGSPDKKVPAPASHGGNAPPPQQQQRPVLPFGQPQKPQRIDYRREHGPIVLPPRKSSEDKAKEEAERKAKEEAERRAKEEQERKEKERKAQLLEMELEKRKKQEEEKKRKEYEAQKQRLMAYEERRAQKKREAEEFIQKKREQEERRKQMDAAARKKHQDEMIALMKKNREADEERRRKQREENDRRKRLQLRRDAKPSIAASDPTLDPSFPSNNNNNNNDQKKEVLGSFYQENKANLPAWVNKGQNKSPAKVPRTKTPLAERPPFDLGDPQPSPLEDKEEEPVPQHVEITAEERRKIWKENMLAKKHNVAAANDVVVGVEPEAPLDLEVAPSIAKSDISAEERRRIYNENRKGYKANRDNYRRNEADLAGPAMKDNMSEPPPQHEEVSDSDDSFGFSDDGEEFNEEEEGDQLEDSLNLACSLRDALTVVEGTDDESFGDSDNDDEEPQNQSLTIDEVNQKLASLASFDDIEKYRKIMAQDGADVRNIPPCIYILLQKLACLEANN